MEANFFFKQRKKISLISDKKIQRLKRPEATNLCRLELRERGCMARDQPKNLRPPKIPKELRRREKPQN